MMVGLEALKVVLRDLRGALLTGLTLGKRRLTLEKVREWSLKVLPGETMQVLMIWIDSWGALCLPLISMSIQKKHVNVHLNRKHRDMSPQRRDRH